MDMNSYQLLNYFPKTQNICQISMKNLDIEEIDRYKIFMKSDPDCLTIMNNEQFYYFYVSSEFLMQKSNKKIIQSFENAIKNKICINDIPVIISINNNVIDYTWLDEDTKIKMEKIVKKEYDILHSSNLYHVFKKD